MRAPARLGGNIRPLFSSTRSMETLNAHCSESELTQYARRVLSWRELLQVDGHLKRCTECAARLAEQTNFRRARAFLRAAMPEDLHLSYEQLEALAEGRLELTTTLQAHVRECRTCFAELRELSAFVRLFHATTPSGASSGLNYIRQWFARPLQVSAATATIAAVSVGLLLASHTGLQRTERRGDGSNSAAARAVVVESARHVPASFEDCSASELASSSADWYALYRRGDFQRLLKLLREPADRGDAVAQTALGLLIGKGLGTEPDPNVARGWLRRAAAQGDACASRSLSAIE